MGLSEKTEQGSENPQENSAPKKKPRRLRGCLWICLFALLAFAGYAFYLYSKITTEPIDPKNASTVQAVGWLTMRDLSQESAETREDLFEMYVGDRTIPVVSDESGKELELPKSVQKMTSVFLKDRDKQIEAWAKANKRPPYLRLDYLIVPGQTEERVSRYVVSDDVQPGPSLKARWARSREDLEAKGASRKSFVEKNVQLLVMQWFVSRSKAYDSTSDEKKRQKLESIVDELMNMQSVYNNIRGKKKSLSRVQALREFEATIESWNEIATVDELAKTLWFKDLLISVAAAKTSGVSSDVASYPPLLPTKDDRSPVKEGESSEERPEFDRNKKVVCDVVRNYFFDAAK